jgi:hypothetical protein
VFLLGTGTRFTDAVGAAISALGAVPFALIDLAASAALSSARNRSDCAIRASRGWKATISASESRYR